MLIEAKSWPGSGGDFDPNIWLSNVSAMLGPNLCSLSLNKPLINDSRPSKFAL